MKLNIPFPYKVRMIPARSRRPREVQVIGFFEMDLPCLTAEEAPIALELTRLDGELTNLLPDMQPGRGFENFKTSYRIRGGVLLKPSGNLRMWSRGELHMHRGRNTQAPGDVTTDVAQDALNNLVADARGQGLTEKAGTRQWPLVAAIEEVAPAIAESDLSGQILETNRAARLAEFAAAMKGSAFIDGVLHLPTEGPALLLRGVETGDRHHNKRLVQYRVAILGIVESGWVEGHWIWGKLVPYNDPNRERAIKRAVSGLKKRIDRHNWDHLVVAEAPLVMATITPRDPLTHAERTTVDPRAASRIRGVATTAQHAVRMMLGDMSPDTVRKFVALREATQEGAVATEIARVARAFIDSATDEDRTGKFERALAKLKQVCGETGIGQQDRVNGPGVK